MERALNRGKKRLAVILAAVLVMTGVGVAFAYWTSTGTGDGSALTGNSVVFTVTSDPPEGTLAPGSAGQTVDFTVTNPGEGTQNLTGVTVALANDDGTAWVPTGDCLATDYTATVTDSPSGEIAAGGSLSGTATVTLANTAANQDDCQGQDVPLYFTAS
ncbi:hypothetical protein C8K30_111170 [Promicromonospora sp. AC04]|uniref:hypothetical protein n=1 Tax=Promicromonospora sp. AC04 TaxID=2135723 RepID=UPI000D494AC4|nr:hypothetical protein [Promicromonospora sp. AC04]PUB23572.1 hypothetical protein C8K30_111170 [Promicromonospora sp. AC04]